LWQEILADSPARTTPLKPAEAPVFPVKANLADWPRKVPSCYIVTARVSPTKGLTEAE
jgi:hypothetical protein